MAPRKQHTSEVEEDEKRGTPRASEKAGNVLVVAEHRRLVSEFEKALRPRYDVWTATSGRQALDIVDNQVDVVAVAPRTTDMDGAKVVAHMRERGMEFKAAVVGDGEDGRFESRVPTPVTGEKIVTSIEGLVEDQERRIFRKEFGDDNPVEEDYRSWEESSIRSFAEGGFATFNP